MRILGWKLVNTIKLVRTFENDYSLVKFSRITLAIDEIYVKIEISASTAVEFFGHLDEFYG